MRICQDCGSPAPAGHDCPHCSARLPSSHTPKLLGAAALLGLGLSACIGGGITDNTTALYGVPDSGWMDTDGDGSPDNQDCDPENPDIYPDAPETADDGVDSNCDGEDNT